MREKKSKILIHGVLSVFAFGVWTLSVKTVDVQSEGVNNSDIGFAALNGWFHRLTGVDMTLYDITDWLGLVPLAVCVLFGFFGLYQLIKRKSLLEVDCDILILGVYYVTVIFFYIIFEAVPVNYRPVLINNNMEASYPSSTTLLVLSVMPTLVFQAELRLKNKKIKEAIKISVGLFSAFMTVGRLISGVHWLTDIVGSVILSAGLYMIYKGTVLSVWNSTKNCRN